MGRCHHCGMYFKLLRSTPELTLVFTRRQCGMRHWRCSSTLNNAHMGTTKTRILQKNAKKRVSIISAACVESHQRGRADDSVSSTAQPTKTRYLLLVPLRVVSNVYNTAQIIRGYPYCILVAPSRSYHPVGIFKNVLGSNYYYGN